MSTSHRSQGTSLSNQKTQLPTSNPQLNTNRSALVPFGLVAAALITSPFLLLIPVLGFAPAALAAAGVVVAWRELRSGGGRGSIAAAGLIVSVVLCGLLASFATLWHFVVADPAIRDYQELHEVVRYLKQLVIG